MISTSPSGAGRRARRTGLALVAFLAHLALPHLHAAEAATSRGALPVQTAAKLGIATRDALAATRHDAASCAVCQALAHGAIALQAASRVAPALEPGESGVRPRVASSRAPRSLPASRAPPALS